MKKWRWQCEEDDQIFEIRNDGIDCLEKNHKLMRIPTEEYSKQMKKEIVSEKKYCYQTKGTNISITKEILDHNIQVLRPQTLLQNTNWKMILTFLPTKQEVVKGKGDSEATSCDFKNSAYFIISRPKNSISPMREILPFDHESLIDKFKIKVLSEWNDVRWDVHDCKRWVEEKEKSDPCELYKLHDETTRKYLEFASEFEYVKFNLWDIATYHFELFDAFPYNDFIGTKRAGKTKSLEFQKLVCYNAIMSPDMSSSALFRIIEGLGATILLDESEEFKNKKNDQAQAVRNLLMQGFLKDQHAVRNETSKDRNFTPTQFNLFSPKSLAHINAFDDVLEDRCIEQIQRRALDEKIRNTWCTIKDPSFQIMRNKCYRLFLDYADEISDLIEEARSELNVSGRELQLWTSIMTFAIFFEKHGIKGLVHAIKRNVAHSSESRQLSDEQESRDLKVLNYLYDFGIKIAQDEEYLKTNTKGWIPVGELFKHFYSKFDEYDIHVDYFTRNVLTQTLKKFGFHQAKKRGGISWLITENEVNEVKKRMGYFETKDGSLDEFEGRSENTSHGSLPSLPSHLGTKPEEKTDSEKFTFSGETSHQEQDSTPKGEQSEQIETCEPNTGVIGNQAQKNNKGEQSEHCEINESSHTSQSSPSSHIESITNYTHFECFTCNTGLRGMNEATKLSGNIYEFHKKYNHQTKRYTELEASKIEQERRLL